MPSVDYSGFDQPQGTTSDGTKLDNFIAAVQTTVNAIDDANIAPAAAIAYTKLALTGKIVNADIATAAAIAASKLAGYPTDGSKALFGDGTWKTTGAANVGSQLDRASITTNSAAISATTEGTAVAVITGNSITYDGSEVKVEFFAPSITPSTTLQATFVLLVDSTVIGHAVYGVNSANQQFPVKVEAFHTPAAGAHVYKVAAYVNGGNVIVVAGAGGAGNNLNAYLRTTKA